MLVLAVTAGLVAASAWARSRVNPPPPPVLAGKIVVKKITNTATDTTTPFTFNPSYGPSFQLTNGGSNTNGYLKPGPGQPPTQGAPPRRGPAHAPPRPA